MDEGQEHGNLQKSPEHCVFVHYARLEKRDFEFEDDIVSDTQVRDNRSHRNRSVELTQVEPQNI